VSSPVALSVKSAGFLPVRFNCKRVFSWPMTYLNRGLRFNPEESIFFIPSMQRNVIMPAFPKGRPTTSEWPEMYPLNLIRIIPA